MKIKIINPDYGMTPEELADRCARLQQAAGPDVELSMECLRKSRVYLDSMLDAALAAPEIVSMAVEAQAMGFDAVVLYCFSDPAVDACREAVSIPVVGGGQAACLSALMVSRQFGLLVSQRARIPEKRLFLGQTGIQPTRVCGIAAVELDGCPARADLDFTLSRLEAAGQELVERTGAQALVLGCLSFLGLGELLSSRLRVPVIDAAMASVAMAVACVRMGLTTSAMSYPEPPAGVRTWRGGSLSIQ